ncbi:hypothetical protein ACPC54_35430 [Kitasatospora sp. NPDC094028]
MAVERVPEQVLVGLQEQPVLAGGGEGAAVERVGAEGVGGLPLQLGGGLGEEVEEGAGVLGEAVLVAQPRATEAQ